MLFWLWRYSLNKSLTYEVLHLTGGWHRLCVSWSQVSQGACFNNNTFITKYDEVKETISGVCMHGGFRYRDAQSAAG